PLRALHDALLRCQDELTARRAGARVPRPAGSYWVGKMRNTTATAERIGRYRRGRLSEWLAAAALLAKGYRILGRRVRTPYGEIDLIAVRGRRLAFEEVKLRATRGGAAARVT